MTDQVPYQVLVMISDENAAGRIVVELDSFLEFNHAIDRQLAELEERALATIPQLRVRGSPNRPR